MIAWNRHGLLTLGRVHGTLEGGGPFENLLASIFLANGERILRVEFFPADEADDAVARFAELSSGLDRAATTVH